MVTLCAYQSLRAVSGCRRGAQCAETTARAHGHAPRPADYSKAYGLTRRAVYRITYHKLHALRPRHITNYMLDDTKQKNKTWLYTRFRTFHIVICGTAHATVCRSHNARTSPVRVPESRERVGRARCRMHTRAPSVTALSRMHGRGRRARTCGRIDGSKMRVPPKGEGASHWQEGGPCQIGAGTAAARDG